MNEENNFPIIFNLTRAVTIKISTQDVVDTDTNLSIKKIRSVVPIIPFKVAVTEIQWRNFFVKDFTERIINRSLPISIGLRNDTSLDQILLNPAKVPFITEKDMQLSFRKSNYKDANDKIFLGGMNEKGFPIFCSKDRFYDKLSNRFVIYAEKELQKNVDFHNGANFFYDKDFANKLYLDKNSNLSYNSSETFTINLCDNFDWIIIHTFVTSGGCISTFDVNDNLLSIQCCEKEAVELSILQFSIPLKAKKIVSFNLIFMFIQDTTKMEFKNFSTHNGITLHAMTLTLSDDINRIALISFCNVTVDSLLLNSKKTFELYIPNKALGEENQFMISISNMHGGSVDGKLLNSSGSYTIKLMEAKTDLFTTRPAIMRFTLDKDFYTDKEGIKSLFFSFFTLNMTSDLLDGYMKPNVVLGNVKYLSPHAMLGESFYYSTCKYNFVELNNPGKDLLIEEKKIGRIYHGKFDCFTLEKNVEFEFQPFSKNKDSYLTYSQLETDLHSQLDYADEEECYGIFGIDTFDLFGFSQYDVPVDISSEAANINPYTEKNNGVIYSKMFDNESTLENNIFLNPQSIYLTSCDDEHKSYYYQDIAVLFIGSKNKTLFLNSKFAFSNYALLGFERPMIHLIGHTLELVFLKDVEKIFPFQINSKNLLENQKKFIFNISDQLVKVIEINRDNLYALKVHFVLMELYFNETMYLSASQIKDLPTTLSIFKLTDEGSYFWIHDIGQNSISYEKSYFEGGIQLFPGYYRLLLSAATHYFIRLHKLSEFDTESLDCPLNVFYNGECRYDDRISAVRIVDMVYTFQLQFDYVKLNSKIQHLLKKVDTLDCLFGIELKTADQCNNSKIELVEKFNNKEKKIEIDFGKNDVIHTVFFQLEGSVDLIIPANSCINTVHKSPKLKDKTIENVDFFETLAVIPISKSYQDAITLKSIYFVNYVSNILKGDFWCFDQSVIEHLFYFTTNHHYINETSIFSFQTEPMSIYSGKDLYKYFVFHVNSEISFRFFVVDIMPYENEIYFLIYNNEKIIADAVTTYSFGFSCAKENNDLNITIIIRVLNKEILFGFLPLNEYDLSELDTSSSTKSHEITLSMGFDAPYHLISTVSSKAYKLKYTYDCDVILKSSNVLLQFFIEFGDINTKINFVVSCWRVVESEKKINGEFYMWDQFNAPLKFKNYVANAKIYFTTLRLNVTVLDSHISLKELTSQMSTPTQTHSQMDLLTLPQSFMIDNNNSKIAVEFFVKPYIYKLHIINGTNKITLNTSNNLFAIHKKADVDEVYQSFRIIPFDFDMTKGLYKLQIELASNPLIDSSEMPKLIIDVEECAETKFFSFFQAISPDELSQGELIHILTTNSSIALLPHDDYLQGQKFIEFFFVEPNSDFISSDIHKWLIKNQFNLSINSLVSSSSIEGSYISMINDEPFDQTIKKELVNKRRYFDKPEFLVGTNVIKRINEAEDSIEDERYVIFSTSKEMKQIMQIIICYDKNDCIKHEGSSFNRPYFIENFFNFTVTSDSMYVIQRVLKGTKVIDNDDYYLLESLESFILCKPKAFSLLFYLDSWYNYCLNDETMTLKLKIVTYVPFLFLLFVLIGILLFFCVRYQLFSHSKKDLLVENENLLDNKQILNIQMNNLDDDENGFFVVVENNEMFEDDVFLQ
eukprot:TRINITY_DN992_c0_g1_i1.p1 TRINITY_DN992_c0_g1~~TRINITY_DN992_c0_g1_i1.p1  ORF type:complete len:1801 (-),score=411.26 TRINITY_DN992_c0_g1_i1:1087-6033(-)